MLFSQLTPGGKKKVSILSSIPYLIVTAIVFYTLPWLGKDTGSFMLLLLLAIPLFCFISALIYGYKNGFHWFYPVVIAVLFFPTIYFSLNISAFIYVIIYGIIALAGNFLGSVLAKSGR
ncbi:MAG: hypothetical protein ACOH15_06745 [Acetobacterium sp.]